MTDRTHRYRIDLKWTGNRGTGTSDYRAYGRDHRIAAAGKPPLAASADRLFRGDRDRWNPEELLVASLSSCHQLWYLHLCAEAGVVLLAYEDHAEGVMRESADGGGRFERVVLRPVATIADAAQAEHAEALHREASAKCFIASSVKFPVEHEPTVRVAE